MQNLKITGISELIHKTEKTHRLREGTYGYREGAGRVGGRDSEGVWDRHAHTAVFQMDNQGLARESSGKSTFQCKGHTWVRYLVGELRSHMLGLGVVELSSYDTTRETCAPK